MGTMEWVRSGWEGISWALAQGPCSHGPGGVQVTTSPGTEPLGASWK